MVDTNSASNPPLLTEADGARCDPRHHVGIKLDYSKAYKEWETGKPKVASVFN